MVFQSGYFEKFCKKCDQKYTNTNHKWCKPCQISNLKRNFTNWTSENKKVDNLIQEMQLKIKNIRDIIFEWIPYNQFSDIEEISKDTVYLAIWKDGQLEYDNDTEKYIRSSPNKKVALKCLHNSQNTTDDFLDEV